MGGQVLIQTQAKWVAGGQTTKVMNIQYCPGRGHVLSITCGQLLAEALEQCLAIDLPMLLRQRLSQPLFPTQDQLLDSGLQFGL